MLAIELLYVMEGFCKADSDDGWVTWVGVWGGVGKSTGSVVLVATMGVVILAVLIWMMMVMRINTRSGEWYDVGTQRWTMTIYY